jgi:uncharacterized RDD family membrane protein YckC
MVEVSAPANWYPDPSGNGGQRYWDGTAWTPHWVPPPPPNTAYGWGYPTWKGAKLGRPAAGPGALANPGRRLAARVLDWLLLIPVFTLLVVVTLLIAAPHFGPIFPSFTETKSGVSQPTPGFLWVYLTVFGCAVATGLFMVAYETVATVRYGRTFGKAWLHIRPARVDGSALGWGRAFGRVAIYWVIGILGWVGLVDSLWCLWDDNHQCLHDKVADSIVINDGAPQRAEARP